MPCEAPVRSHSWLGYRKSCLVEPEPEVEELVILRVPDVVEAKPTKPKAQCSGIARRLI